MVDRDGHINMEVVMPIDVISENLPALKVGLVLCYIIHSDTSATMCKDLILRNQ